MTSTAELIARSILGALNLNKSSRFTPLWAEFRNANPINKMTIKVNIIFHFNKITPYSFNENIRFTYYLMKHKNKDKKL